MALRLFEKSIDAFAHGDEVIKVETSIHSKRTVDLSVENKEAHERVHIYFFPEAFDKLIEAIAKNEEVYNALLVAVAKLNKPVSEPVAGE